MKSLKVYYFLQNGTICYVSFEMALLKMQHFKVLKMDATSYTEIVYLSTNVHGVASQNDIFNAGNRV
jgi:hypothetical protein